jgi:hypothetical protein
MASLNPAPASPISAPPRVVHFQYRHGMRRDDVDALARVEIGRLDHVGADALVRPREHDVEVGNAAVGDPGLGAGERPAFAVALRRGAHRLDVRAGIGLGKGEGGDLLARGGRREIARLLLGRAGERDRPAAEALHDEGEIGEPGVVGEHLAQEGDRAHVGRLGRRMVQVAGAAEVLHQPPADRVGVLAVGVREAFARPRVRLARELLVPRLEEGPAVVREAVHPGR